MPEISSSLASGNPAGSRKKHRGFTFLLALVYTAIFSIAILAVLAYSYYSFYHRHIKAIDAYHSEEIGEFGFWSATSRIRLDARFRGELFARQWWKPIESRQISILARFQEDNQVASAIGNVHPLASEDFPVIPAAALSNDYWFGDQQFVFRSELSDPQKFVTRTYRVASAKRWNRIILIGSDIEELVESRNLIFKYGGWGLLVALALAVIGAWLSSKIVTRKLSGVNRFCESVMAGNLADRIATNRSGDSFDTLARNVNAMMEKIQILIKENQNMADNIAHDLRQPLQVMQSNLEHAKELDGIDDIKDSLSRSLTQATELTQIFDDVEKITSLRNDRSKLDDRPLDLNPFLQEAVDFYSSLTQEQYEIEIELRLPDRSITVCADENLLRKAIGHLIDNARKYSPRKSTVTVSAVRDEDAVTLTVADRGIGILPSFYENVLEPGFRLDPSRSVPGFGLGLSMVKTIVDCHEWRLSFEPNGPGLIAKISGLKIVADESSPDAPAEHASPPGASSTLE